MYLALIVPVVCFWTVATAAGDDAIIVNESGDIFSLGLQSDTPSSYASSVYFNSPPMVKRSAQVASESETGLTQNNLVNTLSNPSQQFSTGVGQSSLGSFQPGVVAGGFPGFTGSQPSFGAVGFGQAQGANLFGSSLNNGAGAFGVDPFRFRNLGQQQQIFGDNFAPLRPQFRGAYPQQQSLFGSNGAGFGRQGFGQGQLPRSPLFLGGGNRGFRVTRSPLPFNQQFGREQGFPGSAVGNGFRSQLLGGGLGFGAGPFGGRNSFSQQRLSPRLLSQIREAATAAITSNTNDQTARSFIYPAL